MAHFSATRNPEEDLEQKGVFDVPKQGSLEILWNPWRTERPVHGRVLVWMWTNLNPKVETGQASAWLKAVKLTNLSQVHLQAAWAAGHGQVSSCGEAQRSPCSRHPPPPAPPPPHSFFVVKAARGVGGGSGGVKL